jgi:hypothetical protein
VGEDLDTLGVVAVMSGTVQGDDAPICDDESEDDKSMTMIKRPEFRTLGSSL